MNSVLPDLLRFHKEFAVNVNRTVEVVSMKLVV